MGSRKQKHNLEAHPLIGIWVNGDEYSTDVEFHVSPSDEGFAVRALDRADGEQAEVYDVQWNDGLLSFATHWPSTGRFVKYRLQAISQNRVDLVYTYTLQEMWHRKGADPTTGGRTGRRRSPARRPHAPRA